MCDISVSITCNVCSSHSYSHAVKHDLFDLIDWLCINNSSVGFPCRWNTLKQNLREHVYDFQFFNMVDPFVIYSITSLPILYKIILLRAFCILISNQRCSIITLVNVWSCAKYWMYINYFVILTINNLSFLVFACISIDLPTGNHSNQTYIICDYATIYLLLKYLEILDFILKQTNETVRCWKFKTMQHSLILY